MIRIVLALLVVAGLIFGLSQYGSSPGSPRGSREVRTAKVVRQDLERYVEAVGLIKPAFLLEVKSKASGAILAVPHEAGTRVTTGTLLVELDPIDEERNLRTQRSKVVSAQATLDKAKGRMSSAKLSRRIKEAQLKAQIQKAQVDHDMATNELDRQKALGKESLSSRQNLENAIKLSESAKSSLELARLEEQTLPLLDDEIQQQVEEIKLQEAALEREAIALEIAELRLKETRILAPMDGIILAKNVERGQIIASGISNVSGGTALMTLADVSRLYLDADVDESDIGQIKEKTQASILVEAYPDETFSGYIERIAPQGKTVSNVTMFEVRIALTGRAIEILRPGMNGTARILVDRREKALAVPMEAITRRDKEAGVLLAKGREGRFVPVKLGMRDGRLVEIKGEIEEGAEIRLPEPKADGNDPASGNRAMRRGMMMFGGGGGRR